jgi:hypothetical protein
VQGVPQKDKRQFDPLNVEALVQRYPLSGASEADKARAAQIFHEQGRTIEWISAVLKEPIEDRVYRWVHELELEPMPEEIPEWAGEDFPLCRNGLHQMTPANQWVNSKGHKKCLECIEARMERRRLKQYWKKGS